MTGFSYFLYFRSNVNKKRQKKTAVQCGKQSSFLEKKPRFSTLTFFFSHTQSACPVNLTQCGERRNYGSDRQ